MKHVLSFIFVLVLGLLCMSCSDRLAGGGTEQPNALTGEVVAANEKPLGKAMVVLRRGEYNPGTNEIGPNQTSLVERVETNSSGEFIFNNVTAGHYYLEIISEDSSKINIKSSIEKLQDVHLFVESISLHKSARLSARLISLNQAVDATFLAGTHYSVEADSLGNAEFWPLPEGTFKFTAGFAGIDTMVTIKDSLILNPGSVKVLEPIIIPLSNDIIYGSILREDLSVEAGISVSLISGTYRPERHLANDTASGIVSQTVVTDSKGRFSFSGVTPDAYYLQAITSDSSEIAVSSSINKSSTMPIELNPLTLSGSSGVTGYVISKKFPIEKLYLNGTHFTGMADAANKIIFPALPGGKYTLSAVFSGIDTLLAVKDSFNLVHGQITDLDTMLLVLDSILFYDFESSSAMNLQKGVLWPDTGFAGTWFPGRNYTEPQDSWEGSSLYISNTRENGFNIGDGFYNFSKMSSFVFYGRGPAKIIVIFHTDLVLDGETSLMDTVELSSEWQRIAVQASDIKVPPGSVSETKGVTWEKAAPKVERITFKMFEGTEYWLDNIHTRGMLIEDLQP